MKRKIKKSKFKLKAGLTKREATKYNDRYSDNWLSISHRTRRLTKGKCCFPGCQEKASETHHAVYWDNEGAIAGREIPGVHVFPLCNYHHATDHREGAHHSNNWHKDSRNPVLKNRNTPQYYLKLRTGWLEKLGKLTQ